MHFFMLVWSNNLIEMPIYFFLPIMIASLPVNARRSYITCKPQLALQIPIYFHLSVDWPLNMSQDTAISPSFGSHLMVLSHQRKSIRWFYAKRIDCHVKQ